MTETRRDDECVTSGNEVSSVPSGFILKLYQMVNGAPDDIISWTPDGAAFIIGSDLNKLEAGTLPQYFRHNRFQSLVRQLNFYSFRKINRERNVWIYKHELFHRDRPEDLHMVRRRTCPGIDGRKQRFSRFSARKLSQPGPNEQSADDSTEDEFPSADVAVEANVDGLYLGNISRKRRLKEDDLLDPPSNKRPDCDEDGDDDVVAMYVDTSMMGGVQSPKSVFDSHQDCDNESVEQKKNDRMEMLEQSLVVSEVAMKLEEHARKAMKGRGSLRAGRGGGGIVTPPWGATQHIDVSTRGLLTYDDECVSPSANVVMDGDDSVSSQSGFVPFVKVANCKPGNAVFVEPPVQEMDMRKSICDRILAYTKRNSPDQGLVITPAVVVSFCMSTPPREGKDLSSKILELIVSCDHLADDFHHYRSALHPQKCSGSVGHIGQVESRLQTSTLKDIWGSSVRRVAAVRDFKIFSVNCINKILGKDETSDIRLLFPANESAVLQKTADIWLLSMTYGLPQE